jgi:uncharacterized protein (DUF1800 family)
LTPAAARHVLNRFAFGPRPGDTEALMQSGLGHWLDVQLSPNSTPAPNLEAALAPYREALAPPKDLLESWLGADAMSDSMEGAKLNKEIAPFFKEHLARLVLAELTRHVLSERQIEEVMVDFWANHFNIFAKKNLVRVFAGDYVERALRPHALGKFGDLLVATARHPAMLIYLDNEKSSAVAPGDSEGPAKKGGLNENYARELLELHTLGVDAGYTQDDVIGVARILTGWSVTRPRQGSLEFVFRKAKHDRGEKVVLGETFPAGHAEDEGMRLLSLLAQEPATARHLSRKLCAYFVADDPPAGCVDAATQAYLHSDGDIPTVLRAIATHPSFWANTAADVKLKTPLEFVASALRALGGKPDGSAGLARSLERLGEPLLEESVPTGYPDAEAEWSSSSGMLARMNFATALGLGKVQGVTLDLETLLPDPSASVLVPQSNQLLLGGAASQKTVDAVLGALESVKAPADRRALALGLFMASPEFQRQ